MAHNFRDRGGLTISDGAEVIQFNILGNALLVDVNPSHSQGAIQGEDLFALREFLLNEFREEAFVRPADPVKEPDWEPSDMVLFVGDGSGRHSATFQRHESGAWTDGTNSTWAATDSDIEARLAGRRGFNAGKYRVIRRGGKVVL